jgi:cyanophycin synthetase
VAVLESALGSGTLTGLGYHAHDVGVFTNVFEDHLGSRADLKTREDIGRSKSFVFSRIKKNGYAVFNADDDIVTANLTHCKEGVKLVPFGLTFTHFDLSAHLAAGGDALTVREGCVVHLSGNKVQSLFAVADVVWTFNGKFTPSVYNLLAVIGALIGYGSGTLDDALVDALVHSRLDPKEGRLVLLKNTNNVTILADYAHEKQSLASVAELAEQLKRTPKNRVIGVLRLAWDRTDELIDETAAHIATSYDTFIIYDKIDGHWRRPEQRDRTGKSKFTQEVGKISALFTNALVRYANQTPIERIIREDEAIERAAAVAKPGDVVVVIVNDDIGRSLDFIKQSFKAELA